jgi:hypothetical protein
MKRHAYLTAIVSSPFLAPLLLRAENLDLGSKRNKNLQSM